MRPEYIELFCLFLVFNSVGRVFGGKFVEGSLCFDEVRVRGVFVARAGVLAPPIEEGSKRVRYAVCWFC